MSLLKKIQNFNFIYQAEPITLDETNKRILAQEIVKYYQDEERRRRIFIKCLEAIESNFLNQRDNKFKKITEFLKNEVDENVVYRRDSKEYIYLDINIEPTVESKYIKDCFFFKSSDKKSVFTKEWIDETIAENKETIIPTVKEVIEELEDAYNEAYNRKVVAKEKRFVNIISSQLKEISYREKLVNAYLKTAEKLETDEEFKKEFQESLIRNL